MELQATVQRVIERLERSDCRTGRPGEAGGPPRMPGLKAKSGSQPPAQQQPRKQDATASPVRPIGWSTLRWTRGGHCPD